VSNNDLLLDIGVSLALSSSRSYLISALAAVSSASGVKTVIVLSLEVFKGPMAALLAAVFLGMVI
jgi:hypothetical protein